MPVQTVPGTDTPNQGRVKWNANDQSLEAQIVDLDAVVGNLEGDVDALEIALADHKTSGDHDGRYYTETEMDALLAAVDAALTAHKTAATIDHPDGSVTQAKLASDSVSTPKIVDGAVTAVKVAADVATQAELDAHKTSADHDGRYYTDEQIDAQQAIQDAALATHKISADHDGRYYTETEINALDGANVKKTGDQTVAGTKTFTSDVKVQKMGPAIQLIDLTNHLQARFAADTSGTDKSLVLQVDEAEQINGPQWKTLLKGRKGASFVDFPNHDVYFRGEQGATRKYVQERVRTGNYLLTWAAALEWDSDTTFELLYSGAAFYQHWQPIPQDSIIRRISIILKQNAQDDAFEETVALSYALVNVTQPGKNKMIRVAVVAGAEEVSNANLDVQIYVGAVGGEIVPTLVFDTNHIGNETPLMRTIGALQQVYISVLMGT